MRERKFPGIAIAIVVVSLLLGLEVARLGVAAAFADTRPEFASRIAPVFPDSLASKAMLQVGQAAAAGANPEPATFDRLHQLLIKAPLRTEPLLVQAAMSERAGDYATAERLLLTARRRNPRSIPALYLLADVWIREGKLVDGLREMAVLSRLLPGTSVQLVPALAEFARVPGGSAKLSEILRGNPHLEKPLLAALAADPNNADLILALAGTRISPSDPATRAWESRLLDGLINRGDYDHAYKLWRRFAGLDSTAQAMLFNDEFRTLPAPPPFNWSLSTSGAGIAEMGNGGLRILYYGRDDVTLASQLLLLPPATYRFEARGNGQVAPGSLVWRIQCANGGLLREGAVTPPTTAIDFTVPPSGCAAQWLQLQGQSKDIPQQSDVQIGPARLQRIQF
jgi:hypothetical protein